MALFINKNTGIKFFLSWTDRNGIWLQQQNSQFAAFLVSAVDFISSYRLYLPNEELKTETTSEFIKELQSKNPHPILDNTLLMDNVSEALYECIENYEGDFSMLVCEAIDRTNVKYQIHIKVTCDETDFIENTEEMPLFSINENNRLCKADGDH